MAVDRSQFINQIEAGLKANKDFTKFYISIKKNQKIIQKVIDYSNKQWDKKTRISQAKTTLLNERNKEKVLNINNLRLCIKIFSKCTTGSKNK